MRGVLTGLLLLAFAPMAAAQDVPRTITVEARGHVMVEPEHFVLSLTLESESDTALDAAREIDGIAQRILSQLPRLEGLESYALATEELQLSRTCGRTNRFDLSEPCNVQGHRASQTIRVQGSPAGRAGDAASFGRELGAAEAEMVGFVLADREAVLREARALAVEQGRRTAEDIASALGGSLGAVRRVQPVERMMYGYMSRDGIPLMMEQPALTTAQRLSAQAAVFVEPGPVRVEERLIITFDLLPPEPRRR